MSETPFFPQTLEAAALRELSNVRFATWQDAFELDPSFNDDICIIVSNQHIWLKKIKFKAYNDVSTPATIAICLVFKNSDNDIPEFPLSGNFRNITSSYPFTLPAGSSTTLTADILTLPRKSSSEIDNFPSILNIETFVPAGKRVYLRIYNTATSTQTLAVSVELLYGQRKVRQ